jgi:hypothetical protein
VSGRSLKIFQLFITNTLNQISGQQDRFLTQRAWTLEILLRLSVENKQLPQGKGAKFRICCRIRIGSNALFYALFLQNLSAGGREYFFVYVRVSFSLYGECGELTSIWTSNQSRIPAEFKHITRRRKRNEQGFL